MSTVSEAVYLGYLEDLLGGDRSGCRQAVQQLLDGGIAIPALYTELFQRSLYQVGTLWEGNRISVATEHLATSITESLLPLVYPALFARDHVGRTAVVSCSANEYHQIGGKMVADLFELHGWHGYFLGANLPSAALLGMIQEKRPDVLALSLSVYFNLAALLDTLRCVTVAFPGLEILVGGHAFTYGGRDRVAAFPRVRVMTMLGELEAFLEPGGSAGGSPAAAVASGPGGGPTS